MKKASLTGKDIMSGVSSNNRSGSVNKSSTAAVTTTTTTSAASALRQIPLTEVSFADLFQS